MDAHSTTPSRPGTMTASRATLRTRPRNQRILIRSWEYIPVARVTILAIQLLVALWIAFLGVALLWGHNALGWTLLPAAVAVLALSVWVFTTAAKGWPGLER
jgi:protein-S-isoprenylcysteine O-methyltransferase Ste14